MKKPGTVGSYEIVKNFNLCKSKPNTCLMKSLDKRKAFLLDLINQISTMKAATIENVFFISGIIQIAIGNGMCNMLMQIFSSL